MKADLDSDYCSNESEPYQTSGSSRTPTPPGKEERNPNIVFFILGDVGERVEVKDKQILMRKSAVLKGLLAGETGHQEVKLPEWTAKAFKVFLHTEAFKASDLPNYDELMKICVKFEVSKLLAHVCPLVKQNLTLENCVEMYHLAARHEIDDLRIAAYNYFLRMGNSFLEHESFLKLDCITLSILISCDDFPIVEITLFKRLKDWVTAQCKRLGYPPDRKEFFGRVAGLLFRHVRYAQMTPKEFRTEVIPSRLLSAKDVEGIMERHKTHPGYWNSLTPYNFVDRPRMSKLQFAVPIYNNVQIGFRKIAGASNVIQESIRFLVSHDIYLTSIGFFGPAKSDRCANGTPLTAYTIKIHVEGDYTKHHWRCPPQNATVITRDNFMIDLSHPFQIKRSQPYKLTVWVDGEVTQFGVFPLPQAVVLIQDKGDLITFHFSDADSDPKPILELTGAPSSCAPTLNPNYRHSYKQDRISGVIRCICFVIKD